MSTSTPESETAVVAEGVAVIDPEVAEEYAESVGIDPTPEQIDRYLELEGDEPLGEHRE